MRATCQEYVAPVPSAAGVPDSCLATAHGGVPSTRGHGTCHPPAVSTSEVSRRCSVAASWANVAWSVTSPA